ncbi:MAG: hypothetical protein U0L20_08165 [Ruminococcus sp.]|nr:hypothetical protein [Ruminococcus sp.]
MTDVKLENGDTVVNSGGAYEKISGVIAELQRAVISISAKKGAFIYDRALGSEKDKLDLTDKGFKDKLEIVLNEALVNYDNTSVEVLEAGEVIRVKIKVENNSVEEVL